MYESASEKSFSSPLMSIGAVSKLTGISVHTLRAWEKRYHVVSAKRSINGRRLYQPEDVKHLMLLRELTEAGHSIGNIASLNKQDLEQMRMMSCVERVSEENSTNLPVCVFQRGGAVTNFEKLSTYQDIDLVLRTDDAGELQKLLMEKNYSMGVVFIFDFINKTDLMLFRQIESLAMKHKYLVVYRSAHREIIQQLEQLDFLLIRAPVSFEYIYEKMSELYRKDKQMHLSDLSLTEVPEHKYTKRQLEHLARIPSSIDCECPKHIAEIIRALTVFEAYCQNCASRNKEDAYIHNDIYKLTAQARHKMETAIAMVVEAEKITIPSKG